MPNDNLVTRVYIFPLGKGGSYLPFTLTKPVTGTNGPVIMAEAFNGPAPNAANVDNVTITSLSTSEYWQASVLAGGNLTSALVSVTSASAVASGSVIAQSIDGGGSASTKYSSIGGTVSGNSINNSDPCDPNLGVFAVSVACPKLDFDYNAITSFCTSGGTVSVRYLNGGSAGVFSSTPSLTGLNASTGQINLSLAAAGTYTIKNSPSGGSCTNFSSVVITITTQPSATISYTGSPYCSSAGTANITHTGTSGGSYSSSAGLSINAASGLITLGASTPGTYTVTYTVAASGGCALYTTTTSVTTTAQPAATISYGGSPFCSSSAPGDATFSGTAGGAYSSTSGLSINASSGQITPSSSTTGTYTVTYTVAASGGCALYMTTTSVTITAQPAATISYGGSPFCSSSAPGDVTFSGTAGGAYSSTSGLSINASSGQITPSSSTTGSYTVTYTVAASGGCALYTATTSVMITVQPAATISYGGSPL